MFFLLSQKQLFRVLDIKAFFFNFKPLQAFLKNILVYNKFLFEPIWTKLLKKFLWMDKQWKFLITNRLNKWNFMFKSSDSEWRWNLERLPCSRGFHYQAFFWCTWRLDHRLTYGIKPVEACLDKKKCLHNK